MGVLPSMLVLLGVILGVASQNNDRSEASVVNRLLADYDREEPPRTDASTEVRLGLYINSFYSVSETTMDYSMAFYLRQAWQDPRLEFDPINGKKSIRMGNGKWNEIWTPDTFFRNEKSSNFHHVTVDNRLLKINSTGHVWYVIKLTGTFSCPMQLHKYPMDTQKCPIMFESFGYTMDTLYYSWLDSPAEVDPQVLLPHFILKNIISTDCSQNYTSGAFPCLELAFLLSRDTGFFLIQIYIPCLLLVILSWLAFFISKDDATARIVVGFLTLLALIMLCTGAWSSLPQVSYAKAIDVWLIICLLFVSASLVEFAVVMFMAQREGGDKSEKGREASGGQSKLSKVDRVAMIAFPVAFLLFNIIFWIMYSI